MKKLIALFVLLSCALALTGCGIAGTILSTGISAVDAMANPDYEGEPETFYSYELEITLTDRFYPYTDEGVPYAFDTGNGTSVIVEKNAFMYSVYSEGLTLTEYADEVRNIILSGEGVFSEVVEVSETLEKNGVVYLTVVNGSISKMKYLVSLHVGAGALWLCYFEQTEKKYDAYEPYFLEWAASVKINSANQEA